MKKGLFLLLLIFVWGGVIAKADEAVLTSASDNIMGGNTATWTVNGVTWTLSGGSITWDGTNNCYTLAASTTYTLTWDKSIVVSKMVANQQINRQLGTRSPKTVLSNNDGSVTEECSNYSGFGDGTLKDITEVAALKIKTGETYGTNKMTYRLRSLTLTYTSLNEGDDLSSVLTNTWTPQSTSYQAFNDWNGGKELYRNNTTAFDAGDILTQTVNVPNGFYEIQFYAFENFSNWDKDANIPYGENICEAFANDAKYSLTSIKSTGDRAFDDNTLVTLICKVTDGKLKFGLRNIAVGGNWAACKAKSLIYLGTGELSLVAQNTDGYWATFSSTYNVEFAEGVKVYTVTVIGNQMNSNQVSNQVPANTGVLINAASNEVSYTYIASAEDLGLNNLYPASKDKAELANHKFYKLAYASENLDNLGFYWGAENGGAFTSREGSAYLAVPSTAAPARFVFGQPGVATAVENANLSTAEGKKVLMNGVLYIVRDGKTYDSFGRMVK